MNVRDLLIALVRYAINGDAIDVEAIKGWLSEEKMVALYKVSKGHDMAHLVAYALLENGISPKGEMGQILQVEIEQSKLRYEMMEADCQEIYDLFESEKIDYMPLKGAVIRGIYPEPWMRTSCDIDILVRPDDLQKAKELLVQHLNYRMDSDVAYHDISLYSPFGMHIELHHSIKENNEKFDKILGGVWEFAYPAIPNGHKYVQSNTYLLFHMIAHTAYHFASGGCGMRSVLDIWLLRRVIDFNVQELRSLLADSELDRFYSKITELGEYWFGNEKQADSVVLEMEKYVLLGGTYGVNGQSAVFKRAKNGGRLRYFFSRLFLPYDNLAVLYPVVKKHKILTPFCQIARWFGVIFKTKRIANEAKRIVAANDNEVRNVASLLESLGL